MTNEKPQDFFGIEGLPVSFSSGRVDDKIGATDFVPPVTEQKVYSTKIKPRFHTGETFPDDDDDRPRRNFLEDHKSSLRSTGHQTRKHRLAARIKNLKPVESLEELGRYDAPDFDDINRPLKAADVIAQIQEEKASAVIKAIQDKDRDGSNLALHNIWSLIPQVYSLTNDELVEMLLKRIIYNERDIIAIDKPYGLATVMGPGEKRSITTCMEQLRRIVAPKARQLYRVHRLDKNTTGVLLLTSSKLRFSELKQMIAEKYLIKKYWAITKTVPDPAEGIIKIPLGPRLIGGRYKMVPVPMKSDENREVLRRDNRIAYEAETEYRVLSEGHKCALVETIIATGVKHQIRSHFGFGLGCPILGDHKYSHFMEYQPQRLPAEVLSRLHIRSAKARHLPIYLHSKEVIIPEYIDGRNLFIKAYVPKFFKHTLSKLLLAAPKI